MSEIFNGSGVYAVERELKRLSRFANKLGKQCINSPQEEQEAHVERGLEAYLSMLEIENGNKKNKERARYYGRDEYERNGYEGHKVPLLNMNKRRLALKLSQQSLEK